MPLPKYLSNTSRAVTWCVRTGWSDRCVQINTFSFFTAVVRGLNLFEAPDGRGNTGSLRFAYLFFLFLCV